MLKRSTIIAFDNETFLPVVLAGGIFVGSFLLFQVQLVLGKCILPWFGGSPGVWNACLLFFQAMLLIGYVYAHVLTTLKFRNQFFVHVALLLASLLFLPIIPSGAWKPSPEENPVIKVVLLLTATVGLPYLLLSASAPLLQHWYVRRFPSHSPWRLYALSNVASLLGLISYPFLFEPRLGLPSQGLFWGWSYFVYVALCVTCSVFFLFQQTNEDGLQVKDHERSNDSLPPLTSYKIAIWIMVSSCSSAALLAVTNELCQDVAAIPFLWMLPLVVYLASFIICFSNPNYYKRSVWSSVLVFAIFGSEYFKIVGFPMGLMWRIALGLTLLLACCMVCHGELVCLRPLPRKLTSYYISIAGGGVLGSAFVSLAAPLMFTSVVELPIVLTAAFGVLMTAHWHSAANRHWWSIAKIFIVSGLIAQLGYTVIFIRDRSFTGIDRSRSFFGTLGVDDYYSNAGPVRKLSHGTTVHGYQFLSAENRTFPTTYYTADGGVGVTLRLFPPQANNIMEVRNKRVGIIGLGVGTVASYGIPGDTYRFYEINKDVNRIAKQYFTFLADSNARIEIVHGDARLSLERELAQGSNQNFDVLIVDAFTSDAIPIHLITREAILLYLRHLKPDGVIIFNISNRYLKLWPIIKGHGLALDIPSASLISESNSLMGNEGSYWCVLTRNKAFLQQDEVLRLVKPGEFTAVDWTDNFASIFQVL